MFESAETKEQWKADLISQMEDVKAEIQTNPFGVELQEVEELIEEIIKKVMDGE